MNKGESKTFSYKGSVEEFTIPNSGLYKLEVWGGQGGGNGGYSVGYKVFKGGTKIYVCVGGKGSDVSPFVDTGINPGGYNGGGDGHNTSYGSAGDQKRYGGGGGGATHIALVTGTLNGIGKTDFVDNGKGLIVAGGGGGSATNFYGPVTYNGGTGGGTNGGNASSGGSGGGQSGGGSGTFGVGSGNSGNWGGGGGGGLYGGSGGNEKAGGGGSGWIGGVPEITYKETTYSPSTSNNVKTGNGEAKLTLVESDNIKYGTKDVVVYYGTKSVSVYYGDKQL